MRSKTAVLLHPAQVDSMQTDDTPLLVHNKYFSSSAYDWRNKSTPRGTYSSYSQQTLAANAAHNCCGSCCLGLVNTCENLQNCCAG